MVKFARCNSLLSYAVNAQGKGCRYVAKGDSDDAVLKDMTSHMEGEHHVEATELKLSILGAVKTTRG
jgi:predicted small metal-binding protein